MHKYILSVLFLTNIMNLVPAMDSYSNGYCWRDYKGVIPADALPAGSDKNGRPIYVGQALHGEKLIPGKIYENDDKIYYEYGEKPWSTNEGVKILCTDHPEYFKWIPTSIDKVYEVDKFPFKGGYQPRYLTYIGRVHLDDRIDVGKVICRTNTCLSLYTVENGDDVEYHKFDILSYNPFNKTTTKESLKFEHNVDKGFTRWG